MKYSSLMLSFALLQLACADRGLEPGAGTDRRFNADLKYGICARNELNTFNDTFTKDLVNAGTVVTRLELTDTEFESIEARLTSIGVFDYPDTLLPPHLGTLVIVTPAPTYILKIHLGSRQKTIFWNDAHLQSDTQARNLRDACAFIRAIIEARPEYRQLPEPSGGYL